MLCNPDGTPFKLKGSLQQFDPTNPDHAIFERYDQEIIQIGGSPIFYYEVFIQEQTIDKVYLEDRGKMWSNFPVQFFGYYEPQAQSNPSSLFGIDTPDEEVLIEANYQAVLKAIGHMPKRGSRLFTPHRQENWVIIDTKLDQFKLWSAIHLQLYCKKFQESSTDASIEQPMPDFTIPPQP